ncbi:hypothetical protein [Ancylobacter terrae]|uniref:hypothetical protein n=1 Tax=Ancylobacter sp. sgz301288 TaxID=3342077 RepID=UPI00385883F3
MTDNSNGQMWVLPRWVAIAIVGAILAAWGLNWAALLFGKEERGIFGDMFGASNALFSGLALAGLIYAIFQQREEIALAKSDLAETKKILDDQTRHIEAQNERMRIQSFEATFFQMMRSLDDRSKNIVSYNNGNNLTGDAAIENIIRGIEQRIHIGASDDPLLIESITTDIWLAKASRL